MLRFGKCKGKIMRVSTTSTDAWAHIMERLACDVLIGWIENKRPMDAPMVTSLGVVNAVAALR